MAALDDESGMIDGHAPYPLPSLWVPVRCVPLVGIRPGRPSVKRGRVSKSPLIAP